MRHLRHHVDALAQRRVGVDRPADVHGTGTHRDGQRDRSDPVARVGATHAAARNVSVGVDFGRAMRQELGNSFVAPLPIAWPEAVHGNRPFLTLMPWAQVHGLR